MNCIICKADNGLPCGLFCNDCRRLVKKYRHRYQQSTGIRRKDIATAAYAEIGDVRKAAKIVREDSSKLSYLVLSYRYRTDPHLKEVAKMRQWIQIPGVGKRRANTLMKELRANEDS